MDLMNLVQVMSDASVEKEKKSAKKKQTYKNANGLSLTADQNARLIDGQVYVLNPSGIVRDDMVFLPRPLASLDSNTGTYEVSTPSGKKLLENVFIDKNGKVFSSEPTAKIAEMGTGIQLALTAEPAKNTFIDNKGTIFTLYGNDSKYETEKNAQRESQNTSLAQTDALPGGAPAAPKVDAPAGGAPKADAPAPKAAAPADAAPKAAAPAGSPAATPAGGAPPADAGKGTPAAAPAKGGSDPAAAGGSSTTVA